MYKYGAFREVKVCGYCKKICIFDVSTHHKECEKIPKEIKEEEERFSQNNDT